MSAASLMADTTLDLAVRLELTAKSITQVAIDAGNTSMSRAGRTEWNETDWDVAVALRETLADAIADSDLAREINRRSAL